MSIKCEVISKLESESGDSLTIGLPDRNGQQVTLTNVGDEDLDALKAGGLYTIAFVPQVPPGHPAADVTATPVEGAEVVPCDHPLVMAPTDAADALPASPGEVSAPPAAAGEAAAQ